MSRNSANPVGAEQRGAPLVSREAEAQRDLGHSTLSLRARRILIPGFLLLLGTGFLAAWSGALAGAKKTSGHRIADVRDVAPEVAPPRAGAGFSALWEWLPSPAAIHAFETELAESSVLVKRLRPLVQNALVRVFGEGNTQAVVARGGWLFFQKDIDYVNGRPFLDPRRQRERFEREHVAADPVKAVLDFNRQLADRGIRLIFMPVPVKPCIEADRLDQSTGAKQRIRQNASFTSFAETLRAHGLEVFDPAALLMERRERTGEAQYLARDTHWTPQAMEAVAQSLARTIAFGEEGQAASEASPSREVLGSASKQEWAMEVQSVTAHGDTVALLGLPESQKVYPPETVQTRVVSSGGMLWKASPHAEVLLLGDSFANIYSLREMGWGEQAGLAEHLSAALEAPVDALLRNSDGAFATRQMLQQELARGRDRLAGKKVVVWECAARELSFGDWKLLSMELGATPKPTFYCPPAGSRRHVEGTVARLSSAPKPGTVPYKEHIMSVLLVDLAVGDGPVEAGKQCLVYTWSMQEQKAAKASFLRPGDRVRWVLTAWEDVQETREKFQRSEFDEPSFLAEPFAWAEKSH